MKRIAVICLAIILMIIPIMAMNCSSGDDNAISDAEKSEYRIDFPSILGSKGNPTFELDTTLPEIDELMIYKVKQSHISADMADEVAKKLGFTGEAVNLGEMSFLTDTDNDRNFTVFHNSGAIGYDNSEVLFPGGAANLPSKEAAKLIATEFLAECGLLPSDVIVEEPVSGSEFNGAMEHWLIRFTINIDGFPLVGPGNKFAVRVGNNGEIGGLFIVWRDVESYKSIGIKPAQQALQELEDGKGEHNAMVDCKKVLIKRVYLAYWMEDALTAQENVVPVYAFEGDCLGDNDEYLEDFLGWCNAV